VLSLPLSRFRRLNCNLARVKSVSVQLATGALGFFRVVDIDKCKAPASPIAVPYYLRRGDGEASIGE
jgi:hypothetical protein